MWPCRGLCAAWDVSGRACRLVCLRDFWTEMRMDAHEDLNGVFVNGDIQMRRELACL